MEYYTAQKLQAQVENCIRIDSCQGSLRKGPETEIQRYIEGKLLGCEREE